MPAARERLKPNYARWDRYEPFPQEMISELGSLGVTGLRVPIEYGGTEAPYVTVGLAAEMLTRGAFHERRQPVYASPERRL